MNDQKRPISPLTVNSKYLPCMVAIKVNLVLFYFQFASLADSHLLLALQHPHPHLSLSLSLTVCKERQNNSCVNDTSATGTLFELNYLKVPYQLKQ